jgi:MoaA/NifB/PqqE/SkfB family radical SAM enzyme
VELSSKCTLKCPRCPRTELRPDNLNEEFKFSEFKTAFADVINDVKKFVFCGDIGDPIYCTDLIEIVEYIKNNSNACISIITNGSYKKQEWWVELGKHLTDRDTVTFSIDGWDQASNEKYRVNCDWDSIMVGINALREHSQCRLKWSAICFSFNERDMNKIMDTAKELAFDEFQYVLSTKFDGRYSINGVDPLKPRVAFSRTGQYASTSLILDRAAPLYHTTTQPNKHEWAKCIRCEKEMFVNVEGLVFPCPWFNSGYQENDFVEKYKDQLNIKKRPLHEVLNDTLWDEFVTRIETMPLEVCKIKCKDGK